MCVCVGVHLCVGWWWLVCVLGQGVDDGNDDDVDGDGWVAVRGGGRMRSDEEREDDDT